MSIMGDGRIHVIRAIPGPISLAPLLREFCSKEAGLITAFSDSLLPACKSLLGEDEHVEIKSFGEVVSRVHGMCGLERLWLATDGHIQAAIALACKVLESDSPFYRSRMYPGTHAAIANTLRELHHWGLDADEMEALAETASERTASKLRSLAFVDRQVTETLALIGRQRHADQMRACLEEVPERDGSFERLLVFAGSDPSPLRLRWLRWLADNGVDVKIVVDRHATSGSVFDGAAAIEKALGASSQIVGEGNRLLKNLFGESSHEGAAIAVAVTSSADPLAEIEWALRCCLASENPTKCAIFVRDLSTYAPLIESAAKRLKVPIRMPRRAPLLTNAFARLTLATLEFCASDDVRLLGTVVSSSYLGLSGDQQALLNGGVREAHRERQGQWQALERWAEANQDKFEWLPMLFRWRNGAFSSNAPLAEWCGRLRNLVDALPWQGNLTSPTEYSPTRDTFAQNVMQQVLAQHASVDHVRGGAEISLAEFVRLVRELWKSADVGIAADGPGVRVAGSAEGLADIEELYVLGMLEGVFPRRRSEDPVLCDFERQEISTLRSEWPPLPTSEDVARAERDEFYRVCAAAKKRLVFSYPQTDDQRDNIPAFYLESVKAAAGEYYSCDHPRTELAPAIEACLADADRNLRLALDGPKAEILPLEIASEGVRERVRPPQGKGFTPGELRDVLTCPFQYVARHRLGLRVKRRPARWASLRHLPQAVGLPAIGSREQAEKVLVEALDSELDRHYSDIPAWEMQLLVSGGRRLIQEWVRREFRSREIWPKEPESVKTNVGFGSHGLRQEMPGGIRLGGTIPAVSSMQNVRVAHLYTGRAVDGSELSDTERLFLGLHFLALHEQGKEGAVEVESMLGRRSLVLLTRAGTGFLSARSPEGLHVVDLSTSDDPVLSKRLFFESLKKLLKTAAERASLAKVDTVKGEHCEWCDFGELCRRSNLFGEDESPFGEDMVFADD